MEEDVDGPSNNEAEAIGTSIDGCATAATTLLTGTTEISKGDDVVADSPIDNRLRC